MSSATPKPSPAKTKSARSIRSFKRRLVATILLLIVVSMVIAWKVVGGTDCVRTPAGACWQLERASSAAARERGLSGRDSMSPKKGMLFVFEQEGRYCFWMKDMRFGLDMIWLDSAGKVVTLREHVAPDTYPQEFCPTSPARYVIEVNAGVAAEVGVQVGATLHVP